MNDFNKSIRKFCKKTEGYALLPDMDQGYGSWDDQIPKPHECCFGARIAKAFNLKTEDSSYHDFEHGADQMAESLGIDFKTLEFVLWVCGASQFPFSHWDWDDSPESVYEKLLKIEQKPDGDDVFCFQRPTLIQETYGGMGAYRDQMYKKLCTPLTPANDQVQPTN